MHERLKLAREQRGFEGAKDAAEALGVKYSTYAAHENGTRGIRRDDVARYAKFFGVDVAWLEHGIGDEAESHARAKPKSGKYAALKEQLVDIKSDHVRLEQAVAVVEGAMLSAGLKPKWLGELRRLIEECLEEPIVLSNPDAEFDSRRTLAKSMLSQFLRQHNALDGKE